MSGTGAGERAWSCRESRRLRDGSARFIGEGSQGAVYDVVVEPTGEHHALKWYFPSAGHGRQRGGDRTSSSSAALARRPLPLADRDRLVDRDARASAT